MKNAFPKKLAIVVVQLAVIIVIVIALLEAIVAISLSSPKIGILPLHLVQNIYSRFDRNVIQVMPECAQYDPYVTYLLKPGECLFENREFSTKYHINSLGLRDDEESLESPKVIALGDSFTMGWGVDQDETFVQRLEKSTGLKILNAGVSSYGTVREIRLLERLDLSAAEYLVLQYTSNDVSENATLFTKGALNILSEEKYLDTVASTQKDLTYFPGKFAFNVLVQLQSELRKKYSTTQIESEKNITIEQEVQYFINVLESSKIDLAKLKIVVFDISPHNQNKSVFADELQRQIKVSANNKWSKAIIIVRIENILNNDMYFILDDHPNALGHAAIAAELSSYINY
ncbi:MAG TPA: hypothetical protein VIM41_15880 [Gammaproteobacteria bacterium]